MSSAKPSLTSGNVDWPPRVSTASRNCPDAVVSSAPRDQLMYLAIHGAQALSRSPIAHMSLLVSSATTIGKPVIVCPAGK